MRFTITLPWAISDDDPAPLTVTGNYDADRGNRKGHPDTWTPAWSEIAVDAVLDDTGATLPPVVVGALCADNRFLEAVEEKINEG